MGKGNCPSGDEKIIKQLTSGLRKQEDILLESVLNASGGVDQVSDGLKQCSTTLIASNDWELDKTLDVNKQHVHSTRSSLMSFIKKGKFDQVQIDHILKDNNHGYRKYASECERAAYTLCEICGM